MLHRGCFGRRLTTKKLALDRKALPYYNMRCCRFEGAWCNGNTWVSKTFVEGSSPSAPAERQTSVRLNAGYWFFCADSDDGMQNGEGMHFPVFLISLSCTLSRETECVGSG